MRNNQPDGNGLRLQESNPKEHHAYGKYLFIIINSPVFSKFYFWYISIEVY